MMALTKLEKSTWQAYFDNVSKILGGKEAEVEISSLNLGDQIEAEWLPLMGLVYDPKSDVVEILMEGLDHLIHKPSEIFIDHDAVRLVSLEVIDADDVRQIIRLRDPLMLPYSGAMGGAQAGGAGSAPP
jgi:hypothetical protein